MTTSRLEARELKFGTQTTFKTDAARIREHRPGSIQKPANAGIAPANSLDAKVAKYADLLMDMDKNGRLYRTSENGETLVPVDAATAIELLERNQLIIVTKVGDPEKESSSSNSFSQGDSIRGGKRDTSSYYEMNSSRSETVTIKKSLPVGWTGLAVVRGGDQGLPGVEVRKDQSQVTFSRGRLDAWEMRATNYKNTFTGLANNSSGAEGRTASGELA